MYFQTRAEECDFRVHSINKSICRAVKTSVMRKFQNRRIEKTGVNRFVKVDDFLLIGAFIVAHQHHRKLIPGKFCDETVLVGIELPETVSLAVVQTRSDKVELDFWILRAQRDSTLV